MFKSAFAVCVLIRIILHQVIADDSDVAKSSNQRKEFGDIENYIEIILGKLYDAVHPNNIEKLKLHDFTLLFNETKYGHELKGEVRYDSGVIIDVPPFVPFLRFLQSDINDESAYITADFIMPNITILYVMSVDLTEGKFSGTSENRFPDNEIRFRIDKNFKDGSQKVTYMRPSSISAPVPDCVPNNEFTFVICRRAKLRFSNQLWTDVEQWINDIILPNFENIVKDVRFPAD